MNEIGTIISRLERQRIAIERALSALREVAGERVVAATATKGAAVAAGAAPRKRRLSAEARRRMSEAQQRRWAAQRAAQSGKAEASA
ncbi:MAG: hypothetical protein JST16_16515 [Bdellovibrionales bacterium]|nr:hypothetical protein [Bdellovibrionales bacterium]